MCWRSLILSLVGSSINGLSQSLSTALFIREELSPLLSEWSESLSSDFLLRPSLSELSDSLSDFLGIIDGRSIQKSFSSLLWVFRGSV